MKLSLDAIKGINDSDNKIGRPKVMDCHPQIFARTVSVFRFDLRFSIEKNSTNCHVFCQINKFYVGEQSNT